MQALRTLSLRKMAAPLEVTAETARASEKASNYELALRLTPEGESISILECAQFSNSKRVACDDVWSAKKSGRKLN